MRCRSEVGVGRRGNTHTGRWGGIGRAVTGKGGNGRKSGVDKEGKGKGKKNLSTRKIRKRKKRINKKGKKEGKKKLRR